MRLIYLCLVAAVVLTASVCHSQEAYPVRPIHLIVAQSPGSSTDVVARLIAERMTSILKRPIVVENQPAAGGLVAVARMAREKPDGYNLMFAATGQLVWSKILKSNLPYDPLKDFTYIAPVADVPFILVASKKSGITDITSLVAAARKDPGGVTYSSAGTGTGSHILMEMIAQATDTRLLHIPYNGTSPAFYGVIAGQTSLHPIGIGLALSAIEDGSVVPIAMIGAERHPAVPTVPTLKELLGPAVPDFPAWVAFLGPAGLPQPIVASLSAALTAVKQDPDVKKRLATLGFTTAKGDGAEFLQQMKSEIDVWGKLMRDRGIQLE